MKRLIIFLLLFAAIKVAGQTTGYLRFDTVRIYKQGGTSELYLINKTKDTLGLLTNVGGGLTRFIKSRALNDSTIVVGLDTLHIGGGSGASKWEYDGDDNLVPKSFPGTKVELNKTLSIVDSGYVVEGNLTGSNPGEGVGYKTFWHPGKAAFRSGYTDASSFNNAFIGLYSTSFGYNATASGIASVSLGIGTLASGQGAIAFGGSGTQATGNNSTAGGLGSVSSGAAATAFGNSAGAAGASSFAAGFGPAADGIASAAFNQTTRANGDYSAAFGEGSDAFAKWGFVAGQFTSTNYTTLIPQFSLGRFNDTSRTAELFRIGWGSPIGGPRANLFSVDTSSNVYISQMQTGDSDDSVVVTSNGILKRVSRDDFGSGGASAINTALRKGIGVDTAAISGNQDTLLVEEDFLYASADKRVFIADTYVADDGSDSDDGDYEATAKATIADLTDSLVSRASAKGYSTGLLKAGSLFREQFTPTRNNIRLGAYDLYGGKTNKLPSISANDVLPSGSDTASMYKISITHSLPTGNPNYDYFVVVEIDTALEHYYPYAARRYLRVASSIANCDATPGTFYQPSMVSPTPVYINPTEGGIGSNKYRYEIAQRLSAVYATGQSGKYQHIWFENGVSGYGAIGGTSGGAQDIYLGHSVLSGGSTHTTVIKSGLIENNVYITGSLGGVNGNQAHVFYKPDGAGVYGIFRRNMMFGSESFLYAHQGEGVNNPLEYVRYEDNYLFGDSSNRGTAMATGVVRLADVTGNYLEHSNAFYRGGAWNNRVINNVFRDIAGESGVEVPTNVSRISTVVDNLIEFFPPSSGGVVTMWSVNQNLHNTDFNHNTVYVKSENPAGESAQVFARNSSTASNTPFDVKYNIFISNTPTGTFTKIVTVDQNSTSNVTSGWVSDYNVYIVLSGSGFRWVVLNPTAGGPNRDGLASWQSITSQDDNSIEIDLTSNPDGLRDIFVDPDNGNWNLTNSANADLIRAVTAGKRNPPTFYPKKPIIDEAVASMLNGSYKTPSEQWQYPNYAGGGSTTADGSETIITAGTNVTVTGTGTSGDPYEISSTGGAGGGLDSTVATTLFWNLEGNTLGSATKKWGAIDSRPISLINGNVNRGFLRTTGQFSLADDTTGFTDAQARFVVKSSSNLYGSLFTGSISGVNSSINVNTSHTGTANNQTIPILQINPTLSAGGFTGVSFRALNIVAPYSGTVQAYVGNSTGSTELLVDGSAGQARVTSAGLFWSVSGNAVFRPGSSSFTTNIERSTGVVGSLFDSTGFHTGGSARPTQKFRVSGNAHAASQGVTGYQAAFVGGVFQNNSTASSGTVAHSSVIGIGQSTLGANNTSVTYTNASTLYVENAPAAGLNMTITNPWALYVNSGKSFFGGGIQFNQGSDASLDMYYRNSGGLFTRLPVGTALQQLRVNSGATGYEWFTPSGSGITSINSETGPAISITANNGLGVATTTNTVTASLGGTLNTNTSILGASNFLSLGTSGSKLLNLTVHASDDINLNADDRITINGGLATKVTVATDGNLTVTTNMMSVVLPDVTADRTLTLPSVQQGMMLIIHNQNSSGTFSWNISGTLHNAASGTITSLANDTVYLIQGIDDGVTTYWKVISIQN